MDFIAPGCMECGLVTLNGCIQTEGVRPSVPDSLAGIGVSEEKLVWVGGFKTYSLYWHQGFSS